MHSLRTAYEDEPLNKSALFSHADLLRDPHTKIPLSSLFFLSFPLPLPFTPHSLSLPTAHPPSPTLPLLSTLSPIHTPSRRRCSWAKAAAVGLGDGRRGREGSQRWRRRKGWIQSPLPPPRMWIHRRWRWDWRIRWWQQREDNENGAATGSDDERTKMMTTVTRGFLG